MRLTEFQQLVTDEFGDSEGKWIMHSHVLAEFDATPERLIETGEDLAEVWQGLCDDFDVPEERRLGRDE